MYIVTIHNGTSRTEIHNEHHKLFSGSVVMGINGIDSFSFSLLPDNPGFGALNDFTTLVQVYNTRRQRNEFWGRVLCTSPQMNDKGLITQEVTCESFLGYLHDSRQDYVEEKNWTVRGLLQHIIDNHNSQVEVYKQINIGVVDVTDPNDNLYVGIQRESSWDALKKKLIDVLGGEIRLRVQQVEYGGLFMLTLDYVQKLGEMKKTEIALSRNMKSIVKEKDPSAFITRLIPLGAKLGDDTEERLDITSVNGGMNYIDDEEAKAEYGIHVGHVEFDDVTEPQNLLSKAREWLKDNNKVRIKYSITALDLSIIDLDMDDFEVCNTYPIKNRLLGISDLARINKKTIDVCDESKTSIEIGESFKTLSELQREQMIYIGRVSADVAEIIRNYVTNQKLTSEISRTVSLIEQTEERIKLKVSETYLSSEDLEGFAKTEDLESFLTSDDLKGVALLTDLLDYAKNSDLGAYATLEKLSSDIEQTKQSINLSVSSTLAEYAKTSDLGAYATLEKLSSEIALAKDSITSTVSKEYAKMTDLDGYATTGALAEVDREVSLIKQTQDSIDLSVYSKKTELATAINGLEIGGRNYIKGGKGDKLTGFFMNFDKVADDGESCELTLATTELDSTGMDWVSKVIPIDCFTLGWDDFGVGRQVTWSFDIKFNDLDFGEPKTWYFHLGQRYQVITTNTDGTKSYAHPDAAIFQPFQGKKPGDIELNKWIHIEKTVTVKGPPEESDTVKVIRQAIIQIGSTTLGTASFQIKNVKLEYGNKATDWTPAPEDTAEALTAVEEEVAQIKLTQSSIDLSVYAKKDSTGGRNILAENDETKTFYSSIMVTPIVTLKAGGTYAIGGDVEILRGTPSVITVVVANQSFNMPIVNGRFSGKFTPTTRDATALYIQAHDSQVTLTNIYLLEGYVTQTALSEYATKAELALEIKTASDGTKYSQLSGSADKIIFNAGEIEINSDNFNLKNDGSLESITKVNIGGFPTDCKVVLDGGGVTYYTKNLSSGNWNFGNSAAWIYIINAAIEHSA